VKPGQLGNFRTLTGEMVVVTRREPGVLSYQRFISEVGAIIHLYERSADSAAALAHLEVFAKRFANRFSAMVERNAFTVFGYPSSELKAVLDRFNAMCLKPLDDFDYWSQRLR
jgi:(4S)-4-hydroxy-5-phosphonooxypentane-2,3-dione isomerase